MKWTTSGDDIANKKAFLRSLMLHIYAQLYTEGCVPEKLNWSYPSSMSNNLVIQYSQIWNDLSKGLSPVKGKDLAICKSNVQLQITDNPSDGWGNSITDKDNGWDDVNDDTFSWENQDDNGSWEDTTSSNSGSWGKDAVKSTGWGDDISSSDNGWTPISNNRKKVEDLKPDTNEINFDFQTVPKDTCMTEACAVANFMSTQNMNTNPDTLTLCFDVGGSTTDISALLFPPNNNGELAMIKQNSIRFAAQRVTNAAGKDPNLKNVLLDVCRQYEMKIPGLNQGPDKYTCETAPFYFEQVLDRIPNEGLQTLYGALSSSCPILMSVNLYVTGLIIYYAGQITNKLVKVIRTSLGKEIEFYANNKLKVNVRFAGKGSRIFEWLSTIQFDAAKSYYVNMYMRGIGGKNTAMQLLYGPPAIQLNNRISTDVKYEVSKGLVNATRPILIPKDSMEAIEILGEDNFIILKASDYQEILLTFDNAITTQMMAQMGRFFMQKQPQKGFACNKFADFAHLFFQASTQLFELKLTQNDFIAGFKDMNIDNYVQNLPEYRRAKQESKDGKFDFVAPIIILEGMKFYDEVLMNKL